MVYPVDQPGREPDLVAEGRAVLRRCQGEAFLLGPAAGSLAGQRRGALPQVTRIA